jgi:filamentous hemagglutinin
MQNIIDQNDNNGYIVSSNTKGSVRPDFCNGSTCSIEVKNYNIANNQNALVNKVAEQAIQREQHLPSSMTQQVIIDIRGQTVSKAQQDIITQQIVEKSNGIIKPNNIEFKIK